MVSLRAKAALSTLLLVVGALLVGDALNGSVVTGTYGVTTPAFVLRVLVGAVAIVLGYRLRTPVEDYVATPSDDPETADPETGEGTEFDPELSPVGADVEDADPLGEREAESASDDGETADAGTDAAGRADDDSR